MYKAVEGGTSVEISGLKCWIPPIPNPSDIAYFNHKKADQFWRRAALPENYEERSLEEEYKRQLEETLVKEKKIDKVTHVDPILEKFRRQQWSYRYNGRWFYNNGIPTYITGTHWLYLQHCKFDHEENDGYPNYYDKQRERFYFRNYCEEDPKCAGYIFIGERGYGKSTEEVACLIDRSTKPPHQKRFAIQSKSEEDAKSKIFKGKVVPCYNSLPLFFKPESNHGSHPETNLSFSRPKKSGKFAKMVQYGPDFELNNFVFFASAKELALDGDTLRDVFTDELGKTDPRKEANVHTRNQVLKDCVFRHSRKVGMIRGTTTVEEMDKGGNECYEIWKESDQNVRTSNGQTISGLYRKFVSSLETTTGQDQDEEDGEYTSSTGEFVDKFGFIDEKAVMAYHTGEMEARMDKPNELVSYMRKHPISEDDIWIRDAGSSVFNTLILNDYINKLRKQVKPMTIRGKFYEVGDPDGEVDFERDDHSGTWQLSMLLDADGDPYQHVQRPKLANNVGEDYDYVKGTKIWYPKNDSVLTMGCDPIKDIKGKRDNMRASRLSAHVMLKYNVSLEQDVPKENWETHKIIARYNNRSDDPYDDFDQIIMAMRYFGCSISLESNIGDFATYIKSRGYDRFVMKKQDFDDTVLGGKKDDNPLQSHPELQQAFINKIRVFVTRHMGRLNSCPFIDTVTQLRDFNPNEITKFDDVVSLGFTLLGAEKMIVDDDPEPGRVGDWFDIFDQEGDISVPIEDEDEDNFVVLN